MGLVYCTIPLWLDGSWVYLQLIHGLGLFASVDL